MKEMNVNGKLSYQLYNFKNLKNTHGGVLLLVKVQGESTNGTKLRKTSQFDFKAAALNWSHVFHWAQNVWKWSSAR